MTRLSLADEVVYAHASVPLAAVGVAFFAPSVLLAVFAFGNMWNDIEPWEGNNDTMTQYLIENMEVLRNGSYFYNFTNPQTGIIDAGIIDSWFENIIEGKYRYDFGNTFNNFCWNRDYIPADEWLPSLFRSTQLFAIVQVPIRIALLLCLNHRLFLIYVALRYKAMMSTTTLTDTITPLLIFNELIHLVATFLFYTLHIWQDFKYNAFIRTTITTALITFATKMVTASLLQTSVLFSMIRGVFAAMTFFSAADILHNVNSYILAMNCDQMVSPTTALWEYVFLFMILASYAMDIVDMKTTHLHLTCTAEEVADYERLKLDKIAVSSRRHHL
ncbi:hypothetical protein Y032_0006g2954 [Ancylostoma ceylanicum]|uniref:Uncharacterized protein n=1 Tax=Ancylostoma ceylanicum TaxID=53326 RepID=A0A016VPY5_9BILA|nr:hypothetical protein Y032_0006g2954 [Ancylostoma ceylanicum]